MNRKERRAQERARKGGALRGEQWKTKATPKRPPHNMTRREYTARLSRRAQRELAGTPGAISRAIDLIGGARREEKAALEKLLRDAGAVDLRKR